jgi:predicted enzyme related to lactoylglutathione lyase
MRPAAGNPVVHLELHTGDLPGDLAFCRALCGWRAERVRARCGSYLALGLGPWLRGGIVDCHPPRPLWLPYVEVPDIERATDLARRLGARALLEPREGPAGWRSVVATPAGAEMALWQPKRDVRPGRWRAR